MIGDVLAFAALIAGVVLWFVGFSWAIHFQREIEPPSYYEDDTWMIVFLWLWPLFLPYAATVVFWRRKQARKSSDRVAT